jgi:glycosyltransferase involved in cell wall biosynthesis
MTTVEALASGAPVIAVRDGNNPNLVTNGENGILYGEDPPRPFQTNSRIERIREAVRKASERDWDYERIQSTASAYDESKCIDEWNSLLTPYID